MSEWAFCILEGLTEINELKGIVCSFKHQPSQCRIISIQGIAFEASVTQFGVLMDSANLFSAVWNRPLYLFVSCRKFTETRREEVD